MQRLEVSGAVRLQWSLGVKGLKPVLYRVDRSQRPRVLRHRSAAARLLGLWVRILPCNRCLSVMGVACWIARPELP